MAVIVVEVRMPSSASGSFPQNSVAAFVGLISVGVSFLRVVRKHKMLKKSI